MTLEQRAREVLAAAYEAAVAPQGAGNRWHAGNVRHIGKRDYADWKDHAAIAAMLAFAAQVRAEAIEEAAKVAEGSGLEWKYVQFDDGKWSPGSPFDRGQQHASTRIATAIRALNQPLDGGA